jgi:tRNA G18 (ribose-2'-O)-methylase SpoU
VAIIELLAGTAPDDPRLSDYRDVREADLVKRRAIFIAEGEVVLRALIERGRYPIRSLLIDRRKLGKLAPLLGRLGPEVPVYTAERELLRHVVGFNIHRGILAAGSRRPALSPAECLAEVAGREQSVVLLLEGLTNHDNVGGAFRNAAALGAAAVLLDPHCADPLYRKAIRVSVGAALQLPFARAASTAELLASLAGAGFTLLGLTPRPDAADLAGLAELPARLALAVGTEGSGLSEALLRACHLAVRIDIEPGCDSLNAATAAGIALHAIRTARRRS